MYRNTSIWQDIKYEFNRGNIIIRLIFVNVAMFVLINLGLVLFKFILNDDAATLVWLRQFMVPADLGKLITRPWTIITHFVSHVGLFHILFNMLWLYWMGRLFHEYLGARKVLPVFVLGAWAGMLVYIAAYNLLPSLQGQLFLAEALGASAGVMAIIVATATLLPEYRIGLLFIGAVKLKYIALVAVLMDVLFLHGSNSGGSLAHLGGAAFGFLFVRQLQKGHDWSKGFNKVVDAITTFFTPRKGPRVHYTNTKNKTKADGKTTTSKQSREYQDTQKKLDEILDKIGRSGYDGLTKEEKEFLFRMSNEE